MSLKDNEYWYAVEEMNVAETALLFKEKPYKGFDRDWDRGYWCHQETEPIEISNILDRKWKDEPIKVRFNVEIIDE